eukprot:scaffold35392_cov68-Phaeocystis_antarctica.AAC.2
MHAGKKLPIHTLTLLPGAFGDVQSPNAECRARAPPSPAKQVISAMRAELRRALTTAKHRHRPPAQSRSGAGSARLRPPPSPPAGPKDAR